MGDPVKIKYLGSNPRAGAFLIKKMPTIQQQIASLEKQLSDLRNLQKSKDANKKFLCGCGQYHAIKSCNAIQSYQWDESDKEYVETELQIECPKSNIINRLLYNSHNDIEWPRRYELKHNAEKQFKVRYLNLFKKWHSWFPDLFSNNSRYFNSNSSQYFNNYYIDQNHKKFGIDIHKHD